MINMREYKLAVAILQRGDPIPIDLTARLIESGFDVESMERIHGSWPFTAPLHTGED